MLSTCQDKTFFLTRIGKICTLAILLCSGSLLEAQVSDELRIAWEETLQYGVDAELSEILQALTDHKEDSLAAAVLERAQNTGNTEVQRRALSYFKSIEAVEAEHFVKQLFLAHRQESSDVLQEALRYIDTVFPGNASFLPLLYDLLEDEQIRRRVITSIGVMGDSSAEEKLKESYHIYRDEESRSNILIALGNIGSAASRDFLLDLVRDPSLSGILRRYAITSLAQCSQEDEEAMQQILLFVNSEDQWIRAHAISALQYFPFTESKSALQEALKDDFWRVRIFALQGVAKLQMQEAVPAVRYKIQKDPELVVRKEGIRTLAQMDTASSRKVLQSIAKDIGALPMVLHGELAVRLLDSSVPDRLALVEDIVDRNIGTPNSPSISEIAQYLSSLKSAGLKNICRLLLQSPNPGIQIAALKSIALNKIQGLETEIQAIMQQNTLVRSYAQRILTEL